MRVLLTAGGTREPIDDVRYVTNAATGALPAAMAKLLLAQGFTVEYLHGPGAILPPNHPQLHLHPIETAQNAADKLAKLCKTLQPEFVACAMAVADFAPDKHAGKLSSQGGTLTLVLHPTPKTIDAVKQNAPETNLLGFKLLSDATEPELLEAAKTLMQRSQANLVFCNDMADVRRGVRRGLLVDPHGQVQRLAGGTLEQLAAEIVQAWMG